MFNHKWTNGLTDTGHGTGTAPTFEKEFRNTRARVRTTTRCCVAPAPRMPRNSRGTTQSRGTQIDTSNSRGTGLSIMYIVTSTRGRGSNFCGGEKDGDDLRSLQKLSKGGLLLHLIHLPSPTTPRSPPRATAGLTLNRQANPWVASYPLTLCDSLHI